MTLTRRDFLGRSAAALGAAAASAPAARRLFAAEAPAGEPFRYGLNTGTLRGLKLPLPDLVAVAAKAGYRSIEPWIDEIQKVADGGNGAVTDLAARIRDAGLAVESAIGFAPWTVDDDAKRAQGLEAAKRDMELVARIGGTGLAASAAGASGPIAVPRIAERYRALLDIGQKLGVRAHLEFWGASKTLGRLETVLEVVAAADHPFATVLPDVYHMYKGGSDFAAVKRLTPKILQVFHLNDYPADPPRETIGDGHRVYPGDGIAPLDAFFKDLRDTGFRGAISLELFNKEYLKQGAEAVAKTGIEKMRAAVRKALG
jgi:sugar phosphate isomerase/epimerase